MCHMRRRIHACHMRRRIHALQRPVDGDFALATHQQHISKISNTLATHTYKWPVDGDFAQNVVANNGP